MKQTTTTQQLADDWTKEFQRTTGIKPQVLKHSKVVYQITYQSGNHVAMSYLRRCDFISAIQILKTRPTFVPPPS